MYIAGLARNVFSVVPLLALVTGCGAAQSNGAAGALPQTSALATHADRGRSWMKPGSASGDLLYASNGGVIWVYSYPQGTLVGELQFDNTGYGFLCSDNNGDVFVPLFDPPEILEYAHGGTQPIATLSDPDTTPYGCAVDPTTGNLAVTNPGDDVTSQYGSIAVFQGAQGTPQTYTVPGWSEYSFPAYDNTGDLFVNGVGLAELPYGESTFTSIRLKHKFEGHHLKYFGSGSMQWEGNDLTISDSRSNSIFQIKISGSSGKIVGHTTMKGVEVRRMWQSWIDGGTVVRPDGIVGDELGFWNYPASGKAYQVIKVAKSAEVHGVTISVGSGS
jgi:hypothetical protein